MRISRRQYWICAVILLIISALLPADGYAYAGIGGVVGWCILLAGRLHDTGRTAWWVAVWFVVLLLAVILTAIFASDAMKYYATYRNVNVDDRSGLFFSLIVAFALIFELGFIVWLGLQPGDTGKNRYGAPPRWP